jgi:hypothetical protein
MNKSDLAYAGRYGGQRQYPRTTRGSTYVREARVLRSSPLLNARTLALAAPITEFGIVTLTVFSASALYHIALFGEQPSPLFYAIAAVALAAVFSGSSAFARDYSIKRLLENREQLRSIFWRWTSACSLLVFALFMLQATEFYSRGTIVVQYFAGLSSALLIRFLFARVVAGGLDSGSQTRFCAGCAATTAARMLPARSPCPHRRSRQRSIRCSAIRCRSPRKPRRCYRTWRRSRAACQSTTL